jgi:type I restriction enzyme S subunit
MSRSTTSYKTLADICIKITDGTHQTPVYKDEGVIFISAKNIKNGRLDFTEIKYISKTEHEFLTRNSKPEPGDLLLAKSGSLGDVALIPELDFEFSIFESLALIKPRQEIIDPRYLHQYLQSPYAESYFHSIKTGLAVKHLHIGDLRDLKIFVPPLPVQRELADRLIAWDTAIETTERLIAAKERHYTHELSRLISRGQHPRTNVGTFACEVRERNACRSVALAEITTIWKGQQLNRDAMVEDGPYYVLNGGTKPSGRTTDWNCEANTITISEGGNSCGFVSYNSERFWCGGHCYALKEVAEIVNVHYLFHYLKGMQERIMALRVGSGLPNIQKSDLETFPVILPDLSTQSTIARYLNALREEIDLLEKSRDALKRQKRGLMQKLLTGEWRVPPSNAESTDKEPAPC